MTPKENLLAMYSHKKIDIMPMPFEDEFTVYPVNGFTERPAFNQGGVTGLAVCGNIQKQHRLQHQILMNIFWKISVTGEK